MNLFFIGTPLQLLNAIEARDYFEFSDNHLVVALDLHFWPKTDVFKRLIRPQDWESVHYVTLHKTTAKISPTLAGKYFSVKFENLFYKYHQYRNLSSLQRIARTFPSVENLILGNYHRDQSRHFPNLVRYNNLYLVDDGTDVLYISRERRESVADGPPPTGAAGPNSAWHRWLWKMNESLRWNQRQADRITFFSAYDIAVGDRDRLVKNDYRCLRSRLAPAARRDSCLFLGQCLVRDGYLDEDTYFAYLAEARSHLKDEPVVYVPHPRESSRVVDYVHRRLGFAIRRFNLPVEWQLMSDQVRPAVLASFFCSALVACAAIFPGEFKLKAFYIEPKDIRKWPEFVAETYDYFSTHMASSIELISPEVHTVS